MRRGLSDGKDGGIPLFDSSLTGILFSVSIVVKEGVVNGSLRIDISCGVASDVLYNWDFVGDIEVVISNDGSRKILDPKTGSS